MPITKGCGTLQITGTGISFASLPHPGEFLGRIGAISIRLADQLPDVRDRLVLAANDCNCARSSSVNTSSVFGLPMVMSVSPPERYRMSTQY